MLLIEGLAHSRGLGNGVFGEPREGIGHTFEPCRVRRGCAGGMAVCGSLCCLDDDTALETRCLAGERQLNSYRQLYRATGSVRFPAPPLMRRKLQDSFGILTDNNHDYYIL